MILDECIGDIVLYGYLIDKYWRDSMGVIQVDTLINNHQLTFLCSVPALQVFYSKTCTWDISLAKYLQESIWYSTLPIVDYQGEELNVVSCMVIHLNEITVCT